MIVWRDGHFVESDGAIAASDRSYLIGDGLFETILVDQGRPAFLSSHIARLKRGAEAFAMEGDISESAIRAAIGELAERLGQKSRAACRLTLSRRGGARGLAPSREARVQTTISLHAMAPAKPCRRVIVAQPRRFSLAPTNDFKCVGAYAPNLLARLEAAKAGADEALLLNEHGRVVCASSANVFLLSGRTLTTPPESEGATPGVTRALLLEIAADAGLEPRLDVIEPAALPSGVLILTNSLIGVAIACLAGHAAKEDPLVMRLASTYEARATAEFGEAAH